MRAITANWWRIALGVAISGAAIVLVLRRTSLSAIGSSLESVYWPWLVALAAAKVVVLGIKTKRWEKVLRAVEERRHRSLFSSLSIGYLGNLLLPLKLGELLRVAVFRRHNPRLSFGAVLATVVAERVIDALVLSLMVVVALPFATVPTWVGRGAAFTALILLAVIGAAILSSRLTKRFDPAKFGRLVRRIYRLFSTLAEGASVLRRPRYLLPTIVWTVLAWLGEAIGLWFAFHALGLGLGFAPALIVTLLFAVGQALPSAPVQLGTHQAMAVFFLAPFGIRAAEAVSLSVVLQGTNLVVFGILGGVAAAREATFKRLLREAQEGLPTA